MSRKKFDTSQLPAFPDLSLEKRLWEKGISRIAGIDEAGRGALAGPVYAASVVLPTGKHVLEMLKGVNDSKKLSAAAREDWRRRIPEVADATAVGYASSDEVDRIGIVNATRLAIRRALLELDPVPDHLLVDHLMLPQVPIPQTSLVKGDMRSLSIAAASILAKTARDDHMRGLAKQYPGYEWERNMGYGTESHRSAITSLGGTPEHRYSFEPLRSLSKEAN